MPARLYAPIASLLLIAHAPFFLPASAHAEDNGAIAGSYSLVSSVTERDGQRTEQFGTGAQGMLVLDPGGRFSLTIIGPGLPKFTANNRAAGTPEETKAVVSMSIAMLGTYEYDPAAKTLVFRVERSTFPNWDGTAQKRLVSKLDDSGLVYVTPTVSSGGVGTVSWRRSR